MKPPNGKGDVRTVASPSLTLAARLELQLRKINYANSTGWRAHGEWMLSRYQRSGDLRDLKALQTHLVAIQERLTA